MGTHLQRAREVFRPEIAALRAVERLLDVAFTQAVDLAVAILNARHKVVVVNGLLEPVCLFDSQDVPRLKLR